MKKILVLSLALGFLSLGNLLVASGGDSSSGSKASDSKAVAKKTDSKDKSSDEGDAQVATEELFKAVQVYKMTNGLKEKKCEETAIMIDGKDISLPSDEEVKVKICSLSVCGAIKSSLVDKKEVKAFGKGFGKAISAVCPKGKSHKKKKHKKDDDDSNDEDEGSSSDDDSASLTVPDEFSDPKYAACWDEMVAKKVQDTKECVKAMKTLIEDPKKSKDKHDNRKKKAKKNLNAMKEAVSGGDED